MPPTPPPPPTRRDALALAALAAGSAALACRVRARAPRARDVALHELTATDALARLHDGSLTSVDYASALLARARDAAALDAFITLDRDRVLDEARAADALPPAKRGPLHGLPIAIKDVIDTAGIRTTYATAALRAHVPARDADIVARLRAAGAIVLGKTNCDELSFGSASQDSAFGGVHNPFDPARIPGGSSGGSAAAVAARLAPIAIGADTTGSIRMPAALCGAIGFRPSTGRYSTAGVWPISPTLDEVGPIARSVDDVDLFDRVMSGAPDSPAATLRGLRVGVPRAHFYDHVNDAALLATVERALARLRDAGVVLVEADLDDLSLLEPFACAYPILLMEARAAMRAFITSDAIEVTLEQVRDQLTADVRALFDQFVMKDPPPFELAKSLADRDRLIATYARYRAAHDVAITVVPATPFTAPAIGQTTVGYGGADRNWFDVIESSTACGAAAGNPGLSLPVGTGDGGMPVALLFEAAHGDDRALLAATRAIAPLFAGAVPPPPSR